MESSTQQPPTQNSFIEDNTKLIFYDCYKYDKSQFNVEEIFFAKPVHLHQIRILKADSVPHTKFKLVKSITQTSPIFHFEIFARNLETSSDKLEHVVESQTINDSSDGISYDSVFPFYGQLTTNHLIIRGSFEKITLCIYGQPCSNQESISLLESSRNDVNLEKLNEIIKTKSQESQFNHFEFKMEANELLDNIELIKSYSINDLIIPYLKASCEDEIKKCYSLMPPNLSMIDKTSSGYIYYENELQTIIDNLVNFYKTDKSMIRNDKTKRTKYTIGYLDSNSLVYDDDYEDANKKNKEKVSLSSIFYYENFQKLLEIIKIFLNNNNVYLEDICVFNEENFQVFEKIPDKVLDIALTALEGSKFGVNEIKYGIQLLKLLSCSEKFTQSFLNLGGLESLYNLLLTNSISETEMFKFRESASIPRQDFLEVTSGIKIVVLELLYMLLSHRDTISKFLGKVDKNRLVMNYFNLTELSTNRADFLALKSKYESYTSSKIKTNRTKAHHTSKNKSRSSSRNSKESTKSNESEKFLKQIKIKNGYQVVLSLVVSGKKQSNINNLIQKILKKVSICLYLKELDKVILEYLNREKNEIENNSFENNLNIDKDKNLVKKDNNNLNSTSFNSTTLYPNLNLDKLSLIIKNLYVYLLTQDVDYKKNNDEEENFWYSTNYPYHHFFHCCSKISKFFYNKLEINVNLQGSLRVHNKETQEFNNFLTNELARMLEQYNFISNCCCFFNNKTVKKNKEFYFVCFQLKTMLAFLFNSNGGINFFSKNYEKSMMLLNVLNKVTLGLDKNYGEIVSQKNMFSISNNNLHPDYCFAGEAMTLAKVLISKAPFVSSINHEFNLKIHLLQLKYLIEENFKLISKLDDLKAFKNEEQDFIDKSLTVLMYISANSNKTNLSKQALTSILTNSYCFKELMSIINFFGNSPLEYEAHFNLLLEIYSIFYSTSINNNKVNVFMIKYGGLLYEELNEINNRKLAIYDTELKSSSLPNYDERFNSFLNMIKPCYLINTNSKAINTIMSQINDACFTSVQKYNLHNFNKPIGENSFKESIRDYVINMKMNLLEYKNQDAYFLGDLDNKNSLINKIYLNLRIINTSVRLNSLLFIDTVGNNHLHLALRYIMINSIETLKYYLGKGDNSLKNSNANSEGLFENSKKIKRVKEISVMLNQSYEILTNLLKTLLASHVDNFRDNFIIDNTISLFLLLSDYLGNAYSEKVDKYINKQDKSNDTFNSNSYKESSNGNDPSNDVSMENDNSSNMKNSTKNSDNFDSIDCSIINEFSCQVLDDLQYLYENILFFIKELLKYNTTIKLSFETIAFKFAESPMNRPGLLILLSLLFKCVKNEHTLEIFLDVIKKKLVPYTDDLSSAIENSYISQVVKLEELAQESCLAKYIVKLGQETNSDFIALMSGQLMSSIMTASYKVEKDLSLHDFLIKSILMEIKSSYEKVKVSFIFLEDKEIKDLLPNLDELYKNIKYSLTFLQNEYKFVFLFKDISKEYLQIYVNLMDFVYSSVFSKNQFRRSSNLHRKMKNKIYELCTLLLNCFNVILDIDVGFNNIVDENLLIFDPETNTNDNKNQNSKTNQYILNSLSEELPNKECIINILTELKKIIEPNDALKQFFENKSKKPFSTSLIFYLNSVQFAVSIITKLSKTFYGQLIITHSDYFGGNKLPSNPIVNFSHLLNNLTNYLEVMNSNYINNHSDINIPKDHLLNQINIQKKCVNIICEVVKFMSGMMFDLQYYEYLAYKNYKENTSINETITNFFTLNVLASSINNFSKLPMTESRAESIIRMFSKNEPLKDSLKKKVGLKEELFNSLAEELSSYNKLLKIPDLDIIINICQNSTTQIDIQNDHSQIKLKLPRQIDQKLDILIKYEDQISYQTLNHFTKSSYNKNTYVNIYETFYDNINNPEMSEYVPSYINKNITLNQDVSDFEKLLSWKKHRICLYKENDFQFRNSNFNIDKIISVRNSSKIKNTESDEVALNNFSLELYSQTISFIKSNDYLIKTPLQKFINLLKYERSEVYSFVFFSNLITDQIFNRKFYNTFNNYDFYSTLMKFPYNCEYKSSYVNGEIETESSKKTIISKLNSLIYVPRMDKAPKNTSTFAPNMTFPTQNTSINKENRGTSIVGGRSLNKHVDEINPNKTIVNTMYVDKNEQQASNNNMASQSNTNLVLNENSKAKDLLDNSTSTNVNNNSFNNFNNQTVFNPGLSNKSNSNNNGNNDIMNSNGLNKQSSFVSNSNNNSNNNIPSIKNNNMNHMNNIGNMNHQHSNIQNQIGDKQLNKMPSMNSNNNSQIQNKYNSNNNGNNIMMNHNMPMNINQKMNNMPNKNNYNNNNNNMRSMNNMNIPGNFNPHNPINPHNPPHMNFNNNNMNMMNMMNKNMMPPNMTPNPNAMMNNFNPNNNFPVNNINNMNNNMNPNNSFNMGNSNLNNTMPNNDSFNSGNGFSNGNLSQNSNTNNNINDSNPKINVDNTQQGNTELSLKENDSNAGNDKIKSIIAQGLVNLLMNKKAELGNNELSVKATKDPRDPRNKKKK